MKFKHRLLFCFTLLAVVWSILYSGPILFQQQKFNTEKVSSVKTQFFYLHSINSNENDLNLFNWFSNKTEENTELNEYDDVPHETTLFHLYFNLGSIIHQFVNVNYYSTNNTRFLCAGCSIIVKYCTLKIPF